MSLFGDIFHGIFGGSDAPPSDPNIGLAAQSNAEIGARMQARVAGAPVVVLAVMAGGLPTAARVLRERRLVARPWISAFQALTLAISSQRVV
jgi:hypothetical protein